MEPDYARMTRLAAIEHGGIVAEVAWIKAHARTLSAEEIHDARQADILGADDYNEVMRLRADPREELVSNAQLKEAIWRFLATKVGDRDCEDFEITLYNPQDAAEVGVWTCDIYAGTWAVDGPQVDVFSFSIKDATPEPTGSGGYPYDYL